MGRTVGIDLGTTYSCIAYINDVGEAEVIPNLEGSNVTPSVVYFESEDNVVVGETAKANTVLEPKSSISLVKRLMGKTDFAIEYGGKDFSPAQISSFILKKLVQDASANLGEEIKDVVITCPAYFGTAEREATKAAGVIAGLNVISIINEPTAAAICYGVTKGEVNKTIMVYDLGGGTFDVTIIRIEEENGKKVIRAIATGGDHELGGQNWDKEMMVYLEEEFRSQNNFEDPFEPDEALQFEQDMRLASEKYKKMLTTMKSVKIPVVAAGMKARIELSREKFEQLTSILLERSIDEVDKAIEAAKAKGVEKIDEMLLVGGSSRMLQVENILNQKYPDIPKRMYDPDEAVAKGAAIFAKECSDLIDELGGNTDTDPGSEPHSDQTDEDSKKRKVFSLGGDREVTGGRNVTIVNITSKSFGVELVRDNGTPEGELYVENLIYKDSEVPLEESLPCSTFADNQVSVKLVVYESDITSESYDINPDFVLGDAVLEFDKPMPKGSPIEVNFALAADGILHLTATDKVTGKFIKADMQSQGIMTKEQIEEQKSQVMYIQIARD